MSEVIKYDPKNKKAECYLTKRGAMKLSKIIYDSEKRWRELMADQAILKIFKDSCPDFLVGEEQK
jgi:hypothetical protein